MLRIGDSVKYEGKSYKVLGFAAARDYLDRPLVEIAWADYDLSPESGYMAVAASYLEVELLVPVTRSEALSAAKRITPARAHLTPETISPLSFIQQAGDEAFREDLKGEDVETVRRALKQLADTGEL